MFLKHRLSTDATDELTRFWAYLSDHRYAAVLGTFDRPGGLVVGSGGREALAARLNAIEFKDITIQAHPFAEYAQDLNLPRRSMTNKSWLAHQHMQGDGTAWDLARAIWHWRDKDAELIPMLSMVKGEMAKELAELCPDHPSAVAGRVLNDWPSVEADAARIEREFGGNPQVAFALARAYRADGREADAKRMLESLLKLAPEASVFEELAAVQQEQGDEQASLETIRKMLGAGGAAPGAEDFGLDHSRAAERMALTLMRKGQFEQALEPARLAAKSYSAWGLGVLTACLTELRRYDDAEQVARAAQERYPGGHHWYRWCQTTGRGDLAGARAASEATAREVEAAMASTPEGVLVDTASVYQLEGDTHRALALLRAAGERQAEVFQVMSIALLRLDGGDGDGAARETLNAPFVVSEPAGKHRRETYEACIGQLRECLDVPGAVPRRDGDGVKQWILDQRSEPYRGNACYLFGRLCELRNKPDEARRWYRDAMETLDWNFTYRPAAAAALRRLGEPYYK